MTKDTITYDKAIAWAKKTRDFNKEFNGCDFKCPPEKICEIFEAAGIADKDSYIAWRDIYRDLINFGARVRKSGGSGREAITRMIEIRRASKIAAGVQYRKTLDKAA